MVERAGGATPYTSAPAWRAEMTNEDAVQTPKVKSGRKKKRRSNRPEIISRNVTIAGFRATVRLHAVYRRGDEPYIESQPWLELRGTLAEAIKGVTDVVISMYPEDKPVVGTPRPAAIGAIIGVKPTFQVVLTWPHADFDRVWALAVSGRLSHAHLALTPPHYNSGLVVSASFSNEAEE